MHVKWLIGIKTIPVKSSVIKALVYLIIYLDGSYVPFFYIRIGSICACSICIVGLVKGD